MIRCSINITENCPRKWFWTKEKETRVKFNPGLSANRPSNNWALIGQNLTGQFMRNLLWQLKLTEFCVNLWCFLMSFSTGCTKWNTAAIKSLLLFMAGLFIGFLVEKCVACQSRKSDFGWHRFRFSPCWMRVEKSLKRFWPYLIAFRSCISNGKPE